MKVKYIGDDYKVRLHKGSVYDVLGVDNGWYVLVDELGEESGYFQDQFEVVEAEPSAPVVVMAG